MPKKEDSNEQKINDLYNKFQSKEFREELKTVIKTRGGKDMEYVPWSNIMDRFLKACPTTEYKFHEYPIEQKSDQGITAKRILPFTGDSIHGYFVSTSITCYGVTRSMSSPVYGGSFHKVNLDITSNQVHNAQMRCLCKNAAMFGLGLELWTREEIAQLEAEEEQPEDPPKEGKATKGKGKWKPADGAPETPEETLPEEKMEEMIEFAEDLFMGKKITHPKFSKSQLTLVVNRLTELDSKMREKFNKLHPDLAKFETVKAVSNAIDSL